MKGWTGLSSRAGPTAGPGQQPGRFKGGLRHGRPPGPCPAPAPGRLGSAHRTRAGSVRHGDGTIMARTQTQNDSEPDFKFEACRDLPSQATSGPPPRAGFLAADHLGPRSRSRWSESVRPPGQPRPEAGE
jgi:hypothetical protein